jgi:hypothetical protein
MKFIDFFATLHSLFRSDIYNIDTFNNANIVNFANIAKQISCSAILKYQMRVPNGALCHFESFKVI